MNEHHLFADNPVNRYAIGDRSGVRTNPERPLDIYTQHENPGPDHERNWLPAPAGSFNVFLRLYWPQRPEGGDCSWSRLCQVTSS
jgi:hypothetical protein